MGNRASREAGAAVGSGGLPPAAAAAAASSSAAALPEQPAAECPVPAEFRSRVYKSSAVYNVYNQRIDGEGGGAAAPSPLAGLPGQDVLDPTNQMPLEPNQQPCPGQRRLLSTERQASNIPKGGTDGTWTYPSPQMFFNGARAGSARAAAVEGCGGWGLVLCAHDSRAMHSPKAEAAQRCVSLARPPCRTDPCS